MQHRSEAPSRIDTSDKAICARFNERSQVSGRVSLLGSIVFVTLLVWVNLVNAQENVPTPPTNAAEPAPQVPARPSEREARVAAPAIEASAESCLFHGRGLALLAEVSSSPN